LNYLLRAKRFCIVWNGGGGGGGATAAV